MNCVVAIKWARDPESARVSGDGTVDWGRSLPAASDDDPAAIAIGAALAESSGTELAAITISGGDTAWAAARGARRTLVITDADATLDSSDTAAALAGAVRSMPDTDLLLIGDSAWDRAVPVALAAELGWRCVAQVEQVSATGADHVRVTRKAGNASEVLDVQLPAVLACAAQTEEKKAPSMKEVLAARKLPQEKKTLADLGVQLAGAVQARGTRLPDAAAVQLFEGSGAAAQLVAALRSEGVL